MLPLDVELSRDRTWPGAGIYIRPECSRMVILRCIYHQCRLLPPPHPGRCFLFFLDRSSTRWFRTKEWQLSKGTHICCIIGLLIVEFALFWAVHFVLCCSYCFVLFGLFSCFARWHAQGSFSLTEKKRKRIGCQVFSLGQLGHSWS